MRQENRDFVHRCHDCKCALTPQTQPDGVIYVRAEVGGHWTEVPICDDDWRRREGHVRRPVRFRW